MPQLQIRLDISPEDALKTGTTLCGHATYEPTAQELGLLSDDQKGALAPYCEPMGHQAHGYQRRLDTAGATWPAITKALDGLLARAAEQQREKDRNHEERVQKALAMPREQWFPISNAEPHDDSWYYEPSFREEWPIEYVRTDPRIEPEYTSLRLAAEQRVQELCVVRDAWKRDQDRASEERSRAAKERAAAKAQDMRAFVMQLGDAVPPNLARAAAEGRDVESALKRLWFGYCDRLIAHVSANYPQPDHSYDVGLRHGVPSQESYALHDLLRKVETDVDADKLNWPGMTAKVGEISRADVSPNKKPFWRTVVAITFAVEAWEWEHEITFASEPIPDFEDEETEEE